MGRLSKEGIQAAVDAGVFTDVSEDTLRTDLNESYADMLTCEIGLKHGITATNTTKSLQERADCNKSQMNVIEAILRKRGLSTELQCTKEQ